MTSKTKFPQRIFTPALPKRILAGATIGFIFITLFVMGVDNPDPEWPKYWKIRPMLVVAIAGAIGGAFYDLMHLLRYQGGTKKVLGLILGVIGFLITLWLGSVYGLDGTLWD